MVDKKPCLCNRLYCVSTPIAITEYAFSASLCRIREYKTFDGLRYCLTVFSLADYRQLHFPFDEYKCLMVKLYTLLSMRAIFPPTHSDTCKLNVNALSLKQMPLTGGDFKIKFGRNCLNIGPVTAFGLVNTCPFDDIDIFSVANKKDLVRFGCDRKWDICTCGMCPVFKRLVDFESTACNILSNNVLFD